MQLPPQVRITNQILRSAPGSQRAQPHINNKTTGSKTTGIITGTSGLMTVARRAVGRSVDRVEEVVAAEDEGLVEADAVICVDAVEAEEIETIVVVEEADIVEATVEEWSTEEAEIGWIGSIVAETGEIGRGVTETEGLDHEEEEAEAAVAEVVVVDVEELTETSSLCNRPVNN